MFLVLNFANLITFGADSMSNILYEPFDIQKHKANFTNYLEVCISPDGIVHYAVPSHQEFLSMIVMEKNHWTREELIKNCPIEYYGDYLKWLIIQSGGWIPVWENFIEYYKSLTKEQIITLKKLKMNGLYKGKMVKGV